jgi:hypothetical protein
VKQCVLLGRKNINYKGLKSALEHFWIKIADISGQFRVFYNKELSSLNRSLSVVRAVKSRSSRWAGVWIGWVDKYRPAQTFVRETRWKTVTWKTKKETGRRYEGFRENSL